MGLEAVTTNFVGRDVSSTCNSSGSALWASAKNFKPLVDANIHTEAIEFVYHQSPIRFSPIDYQNPGFMSHPPSGQTILFGCPLEPCTVGELKKIPPVLEYLLDSVRDWPQIYSFYKVGQKHRNCMTNSLHCKSGGHWPLVNEIEVWRKAIALFFQILSEPISGPLFWFVCSETPIQGAKRPCRNTFGPFQRQYYQKMTLHWL